MNLAGRETALIVCKGGATVNKLIDEYNVTIDVNKEKDDTSVVKPIGTFINVASAKAAIQDILFNNEEVEVSIIVDGLSRNLLLPDSGLVIIKKKKLNQNAIIKIP